MSATEEKVNARDAPIKKLTTPGPGRRKQERLPALPRKGRALGVVLGAVSLTFGILASIAGAVGISLLVLHKLDDGQLGPVELMPRVLAVIFSLASFTLLLGGLCLHVGFQDEKAEAHSKRKELLQGTRKAFPNFSARRVAQDPLRLPPLRIASTSASKDILQEFEIEPSAGFEQRRIPAMEDSICLYKDESGDGSSLGSNTSRDLLDHQYGSHAIETEC